MSEIRKETKMNVIISGLTCSGKTTLSNEIKDTFKDTTILREDDYMKDLKDVPHTRNYYLLDVANAYHIEEFRNDVIRLLNDGIISYPIYDVSTNRRISKSETRTKGQINVLEGLHTIDALKGLRDSIKVFMNIDPKVCLERRIKRDTNLYNAREEDVRRYFNEGIMSIYKTHILPQMKDADIVIEKEEDKQCLLRKLQTYY